MMAKALATAIALTLLAACGAGTESDGGRQPVSTPPPAPEPDPEPVAAEKPIIKGVEFGERPILYVLVDFQDWATELDDDTHFNRMYFDY